jgi:hypothetical protein
MKPLIQLLLVVLLALAGCQSDPTIPAASAQPRSQLQFVDFPGFDRDLSRSLSEPLPQVDVTFYDRVTTSALPERLQQWMASIEAGGGTVSLVPPKSTVASRSPMLLISAITSIYSASKMAKELAIKEQFAAAHAYDAAIVLKIDDRGESVVDKVVFTQRKKQ